MPGRSAILAEARRSTQTTLAPLAGFGLLGVRLLQDAPWVFGEYFLGVAILTVHLVVKYRRLKTSLGLAQE